MGKYKGYNPNWGKEATQKYIKDKQQRVEVKWKKTEYAEHIEPAIKKSGLPVSTYIKRAVEEKISNDAHSPAPPAGVGHWVMSDDLHCPVCDHCGAHPWKGYIPTVEEATEMFKFCPKCGISLGK